MPAQGGKAIQVTRKGGGGEETQVLDRVIALRGFAVTHLGIYYLAKSNTEFSIQFFSFATTKTETIAKVERPTLGSLTVSPDGKSILYGQVDQLGSDLMLVENFR